MCNSAADGQLQTVYYFYYMFAYLNISFESAFDFHSKRCVKLRLNKSKGIPKLNKHACPAMEEVVRHKFPRVIDSRVVIMFAKCNY